MRPGTLDTWTSLLGTDLRGELDRAIPRYLSGCRWFGDKGRAVTGARLIETVPFGASAAFHLVRVSHGDGTGQTWLLPLALVRGASARRFDARSPDAVVMSLRLHGARCLVVDATADVEACRQLLGVVDTGRVLRGVAGVATVARTAAYRRLRGPRRALTPRPSGAEQSNTSVVYGERLIIKVYRRLTRGLNPELEIGRALAARGYDHTPHLAASIDYQGRRGPAMTLALVQGFIANRGDAWSTALGQLGRFLTRASRCNFPPPASLARHLGAWLEAAELLGRRTAQLHLALATHTKDPDFAPRPAGAAFRRAAHQSMVELTGRTLRQLRQALPRLSTGTRALARRVLADEAEVRRRFDAFLHQRLTVTLTRCHGDFHLGQVIDTGSDFVITDFEGEPLRPLRERRSRHSPLRDVAGMLRSLHYAALTALGGQRRKPHLRSWAEAWHLWSSRAFLRAYLSTARGAAFLPRAPAELRLLLDTFLLEKAVYELGYELNNRPMWLHIPLLGVEQLLGHGGVDASFDGLAWCLESAP